MSDWRDVFEEDFHQQGWSRDVGIGDGWKDILLKLKHDLAATGVVYKICQIKEKFGGLRFYVDIMEPASEAKTDEFHALIGKAEDDSYKTCERCGEPGLPGGKGWIKTACVKCRAKE
jgi:hypothetical protein